MIKFRILPERPALGDFLLAAVILAVSLAGLVPRGQTAIPSELHALVYQADRLVADLSLQQTKTIALNSLTVEIKAGAVRIAKSDCPRGLCTHAGWISAPGGTIVCVPNKVLIEVAGPGAPAPYDVVTY